MTLTFMIAAGVVFGLLYFMRFRRQANRAEKLESFNGKPAPCPHCHADLVISKSWVRTAAIKRRGELFDCTQCGLESNWDFGVNPPRLIDREIQSGRRKPRPGRPDRRNRKN